MDFGGSAPRVCGDDPPIKAKVHKEDNVLPAYAGMIPVYELTLQAIPLCSPRMRGSSSYVGLTSVGTRVLPAYAGIDPVELKRASLEDVCSPRMRGSSQARVSGHQGDGVLPAYAGIILGLDALDGDHPRAPRVCGDHPVSRARRGGLKESAPRVCGDHPSIRSRRFPGDSCSPRMRG